MLEGRPSLCGDDDRRNTKRLAQPRWNVRTILVDDQPRLPWRRCTKVIPPQENTLTLRRDCSWPRPCTPWIRIGKAQGAKLIDWIQRTTGVDHKDRRILC